MCREAKRSTKDNEKEPTANFSIPAFLEDQQGKILFCPKIIVNRDELQKVGKAANEKSPVRHEAWYLQSNSSLSEAGGAG